MVHCHANNLSHKCYIYPLLQYISMNVPSSETTDTWEKTSCKLSG